MARDSNSATNWWNIGTASAPSIPSSIDPLASSPRRKTGAEIVSEEESASRDRLNPGMQRFYELMERFHGPQEQGDPNVRLKQAQSGRWHTRVGSGLHQAAPVEVGSNLDGFHQANNTAAGDAPRGKSSVTDESWNARFAPANPSGVKSSYPPSSVLPTQAPAATLPKSIATGISSPITGTFKSGVYTGFKTPYGTVASRPESPDERIARLAGPARRIASR